MAVAPPSTAMIWPVMNDDAAEAKRTAMPFRSWSPPMRRKGVPLMICSPERASVAAVILVGKKPGQMQLTVMLYSASVAARARVKLTTAPLLVLYGSVGMTDGSLPLSPATDA